MEISFVVVMKSDNTLCLKTEIFEKQFWAKEEEWSLNCMELLMLFFETAAFVRLRYHFYCLKYVVNSNNQMRAKRFDEKKAELRML